MSLIQAASWQGQMVADLARLSLEYFGAKPADLISLNCCSSLSDPPHLSERLLPRRARTMSCWARVPRAWRGCSWPRPSDQSRVSGGEPRAPGIQTHLPAELEGARGPPATAATRTWTSSGGGSPGQGRGGPDLPRGSAHRREGRAGAAAPRRWGLESTCCG